MSSNRIIIAIVGLAILTIVTVWAINSFEIVEVDADIPQSRAARKDPWLAIERSLMPSPGIIRYKKAVEIELAKASVIAIDAASFASLNSDRVADWVGSGGCLIVYFEYESSDDKVELPQNPLFKNLSADYSSDEQNEWSDVTDRLAQSNKSLKNLPGNITVDMSVNFSNAEEDDTTGVYYVSNEKKAVVRVYGSGVVFTSGVPFALYNDGLKKEENRKLAAFLFDRIRTQGLGTEVWLPPVSPHINPKIKPLDARPVLFASLIMFIMLFWIGCPRIGSVIPDEIKQRRSLRERFGAEGNFLWRYKAGNYMLGTPDRNFRWSKKAFIDAVNSIIKSEHRSGKKS